MGMLRETVEQNTASPGRGFTGDFHLSGKEQRNAIAGFVALILTITLFSLVPSLTAHVNKISPYKQAFIRLHLIMVGVFVSGIMLSSALQATVVWLRLRWRDSFTYIALSAMCAFLFWFVVHYGRWQFGAFDFNILIEMGWRQMLGQRPYVNFPATTPPGFNLGTKYAFELFGLNWDANLYFAAIFTCVSFLWIYWLLRRLSAGRLASLAVALAIEAAAMLTLDFWWYNNSALICAAVFFLSCLAYAKQPRLFSVNASYFFSLTILSLMKPNIAGLTIVGSVLVLFVITESKLRFVLLTLGATLAALAVLVLNHVPVVTMLTSYLSVAEQRGGIGARFGFNLMSRSEKGAALFWLGFVSLPMLGLIPRGMRQIRERDWRGLGLSFLLPVSLLVGLYGLATNGEFRDVECTVILAAIGALTFGLRWSRPFLRRVCIGVICASIACDLFYGATRTRVYEIGPRVFFEWQDNEHRIDSGFLKNMRVSGSMVEVENEVAQALNVNRGPYFFGTRLDFNYAVFGIHSPEQFPAWWHPGTAFPLSDESKIIEQWRQDRFETLIFMKTGFADDDERMFYTYYPRQFLDAIHNGYVVDNSYPDITVYHRLKAAP
jgi:hypothetical protein